jgi:hypothetical protein
MQTLGSPLIWSYHTYAYVYIHYVHSNVLGYISVQKQENILKHEDCGRFRRLLLLFVLVVGPISTAAMKAYCTLHPNGVPSFISRGAAHQAA